MNDIIRSIFARFGIPGLIVLCFLGAGVWYVAHASNEEGESVSILWGMVVYTKKISSVPPEPGEPQRVPITIVASQFEKELSSGVGVGVLSYGANVMTNLDGQERPNTAIFKVPDIVPGKYALLVEYAAADSRPVVIKFNGTVIRTDGLSQTTSGWQPGSQRWIEQGRIDVIAQSGNTLMFHRDSVFPHIRAIRFRPLPE